MSNIVEFVFRLCAIGVAIYAFFSNDQTAATIAIAFGICSLPLPGA